MHVRRPKGLRKGGCCVQGTGRGACLAEGREQDREVETKETGRGQDPESITGHDKDC